MEESNFASLNREISDNIYGTEVPPHFEYLADHLIRVFWAGDFNSGEKIAKIGRLRAPNYSYYFSPSVPFRGTPVYARIQHAPRPVSAAD